MRIKEPWILKFMYKVRRVLEKIGNITGIRIGK